MSRRVAHFLKEWLDKYTIHETEIIDLKDWNLAPVQSVFVSMDRTPDAYKTLAERIFNADAFILVTPESEGKLKHLKKQVMKLIYCADFHHLATPEYNGSYSPAMKNLLDHFPKQHHKPFGIVTASPGAFGGMRAAQQLLQLVPALFGIASPYLLIVPSVDKKFDENGQLMESSFEKNVHNFISEYLWLAEHLVEEKIIA